MGTQFGINMNIHGWMTTYTWICNAKKIMQYNMQYKNIFVAQLRRFIVLASE